MKRFLQVALAFALVVGLAVGCSKDEDSSANPFKGTWSAQGYPDARLIMGESSWTFSGPASASGTYSYQGTYPDFVLTMVANGESASANVHFNDKSTAVVSSGGQSLTLNKV